MCDSTDGLPTILYYMTSKRKTDQIRKKNYFVPEKF